MQRALKTFILALQVVGGSPAFADGSPSAEDLLKDSDRARGSVGSGISWRSSVETSEDGNVAKMEYVIRAKGDQAVAETVAPDANKGEYLVFKERNLWFLKPGMKRPVVISARQKLTGPASNADIAATNYYRDYDGKIVGEEKIDGVDCFKLDLKAKSKSVSYNGIRYWVTKDSHLGIKAEFLSIKGDVFKTAIFKYDNKFTVEGKTIPFMSAIAIADAQKSTSRTAIKIDAPKNETIADGSLDLANFKK